MHNDDNFSRKFKKFVASLNHKKSKKKILSLHATLDTDTTRIKFIRFINGLGGKTSVFFVKKRLNQNGLFDYHKMLGRMVEIIDSEKICISSPILKQLFQDQIKQIDGRIDLVSAHRTPEVQVADMFAWATFKKLEDKNDIYFKLLADKVELVEIKI